MTNDCSYRFDNNLQWTTTFTIRISPKRLAIRCRCRRASGWTATCLIFARRVSIPTITAVLAIISRWEFQRKSFSWVNYHCNNCVFVFDKVGTTYRQNYLERYSITYVFLVLRVLHCVYHKTLLTLSYIKTFIFL